MLYIPIDRSATVAFGDLGDQRVLARAPELDKGDMMLKYLRSRGRPLILLTAVGLAALGLNSVPSQAALDNSMFESADGNLVLDGNVFGDKDWFNAPNLSVAHDKSIKLKQVDDFYQGGPKHDNPCPTVKEASAGLPSSKDDLLEFYVSHDTVGTDNFLYLGWERFLDKESTASAHLDFEFNQERTHSCSNNDVNVDRTAGDVMITFDLTGGGTPQFHLLRWLTSLGPGDDCEAAAAAPCWGNSQDLTGTAEGAVNSSAPISDPVANRTLNFKNQFGEAAINLTRSGVFAPGTCAHFGNAILASRSSGSSFNSGLDDFVGPLDVDIQNCGSIKIQKTDDAGHGLPNITFTAFLDVNPNDGEEAPTAADLEESRGQCTTSDGTGEGTVAGECTMEGLFQGFYWVMEDASDVPDGYTSVGPIRVEVEAGKTLALPVKNPRKHRVIVIVCHEGDDSLFASEVVRGTESHDSLGEVPGALVGKVTEAQLCSLGGAQFNGLTHADHSFTAKLEAHD
jgi:hypothetical protein